MKCICIQYFIFLSLCWERFFVAFRFARVVFRLNAGIKRATLLTFPTPPPSVSAAINYEQQANARSAPSSFSMGTRTSGEKGWRKKISGY